MAENIDYAVKGDKLTIIVDLSKTLGDSKSGKTKKVASSNGFITLEGGAMFSLNVNKKDA